MLREKGTGTQGEYDIVLLEELMAEDHLLHKIDAAVDFSFIHDLCKDLYSPNIGRRPIWAGCHFAYSSILHLRCLSLDLCMELIVP